MKKYKTGDTIYLKGIVRSVDDTALPYCVYFRNYNTVWVTSDNIIDELPTTEPVKPVLPKAVADEMSYVKSFDGITFDGYIVQIINGNSTYKNSRAFWTNNSVGIIKTLMDAWYNGYTVKKEPVNLVYVPGTNKKFLYNKRGDRSTRAAKLETPIVPSPVTSYQTSYDQYKPLYWFDDAEITKFGLQDCEREEVINS